ncbi:MAG TPA: HNH endonuclease [Candidatus Dietzia intestinigallinarum]|nr:HNH endonuclease [Candidatus Dietzia intestinigallinarum]
MSGNNDDDTTTGPAAPGSGAGSESAISRAAHAAFESWQAANKIAGQRLVAAHELMAECVAHPDCQPDPRHPGRSVVDPEVMAASRLALLFPLSSFKASSMLVLAADLHFRFPAILAAMLAGRMDESTARALAQQMNHVDDAVLPGLQQEVVDDYLSAIDEGRRPGMNAVRSRADELITACDPNAVRERLTDAGRDRGARISKARDGLATLYATLHADEAAVLAEALDAKVAADRQAEEEAAAAAATGTGHSGDAASGTDDAGCDGGDGLEDGDELYSLDQRRADALMSLTCGDAQVPATTGPDEPNMPCAAAPDSGDPAAPAATDSSSTSGAAGMSVTLRPRVTVIAANGCGEARVEFARTGQAALQALLEMLATTDGASLEMIDPAIGADDAPDAARRYRPGAALARRIRLRDGTCRHPGCQAPIEFADLDHVVPFNHDNPQAGGLTVETNLVGFCRKHHRFKTFNDWHYQLEPDGTLHITLPDGRTMSTWPDGPLARYRRELADTEDAAWQRQQRRAPREDATNPATQTSWARRAARRRADKDNQREENQANRATNARRAAWEAKDAKRADELAEAAVHATDRAGDFTPIHVPLHPITTDMPAHRHSRWWAANADRFHDPASVIETALHEFYTRHLEPPPPF